MTETPTPCTFDHSRGPVLPEHAPSDLLPVPDAAAYITVSPRFVRRLISERRITVVKLGKHVRLRRSDLDAYIAAGTREAVTK